MYWTDEARKKRISHSYQKINIGNCKQTTQHLSTCPSSSSTPTVSSSVPDPLHVLVSWDSSVTFFRSATWSSDAALVKTHTFSRAQTYSSTAMSSRPLLAIRWTERSVPSNSQVATDHRAKFWHHSHWLSAPVPFRTQSAQFDAFFLFTVSSQALYSGRPKLIYRLRDITDDTIKLPFKSVNGIECVSILKQNMMTWDALLSMIRMGNDNMMVERKVYARGDNTGTRIESILIPQEI